MERKLAEFRARRQAANAVKKDEGAPDPKSGVQRGGNTSTMSEATADDHHEEERAETSQASTHSDKNMARRDWLLDSALGQWLSSKQFVISNVFLLKVLLWLVLLGLFIELEFGFPFFVLSLFYWIYEGLRSPGAREPGELSAYSVFNPDCQPLLGSLTAEQLEGEMGYRPLANR
ncbi:SAYSvFN domain-containing protein 1 [Sphaeramia orbicularis]|uniref:SAYSvFN domain-containing protein 1 n=1 Tax=Sphaeramia orbicularis TaxID=375764 RepID=UPI0011802297|nr:SAYSvFN domain-containing protein 1 [Sphaeramia orbicularis]XP_029983847.1 SAYSvFN domain-containing protein 1 [Sphaeramia orbicularis]